MSPEHLARRTFLRAAVLAGAAASATGCAPPTTPRPVPTRSTTRAGQEPVILLAYFSRPGENYFYGDRRDLDVGNTEVLARMIAARVDCDTYRINAADPYPHDYAETVARNVREQDDDARPTIADPLPVVSAYTTIILASPIWNVRPPMIMSTFVDALPLAGKTLLPVTTHAMSGLGRSVAVYTDRAPDAVIGDGLAVRGEEVVEAGADLDEFLGAAL